VWIPREQIDDPGQQYLVGQYKLAYLRGKGRKYVPVLVLLDLITATHILNSDRHVLGINKENSFLFAKKNSMSNKSMSHCSGSLARKSRSQ